VSGKKLFFLLPIIFPPKEGNVTIFSGEGCSSFKKLDLPTGDLHELVMEKCIVASTDFL
jgi:hypothetical protein